MDWRSKEYKAQKAEQLKAVNLEDYELTHDGETRLCDYILEVRENPEGHNLFEILSVLRFLRLWNKYEFRWKPVHVFAALYENLSHSGVNGRQCYRLTPIQFFQFANIKGLYEWVAIDGDPRETAISERVRIQDGQVYKLRRLITKGLLELPRKFAKTTEVTALAIDDMIFGDDNAQAYTAANSYKQAKVCFDEISKSIRPLDPDKNRFKITRETIKWKPGNEFGKESSVECLSGGADSKDGLNASLVVFDEYAAAKYTRGHSDGAELLHVLTSSMGARWEPLTMIITTASRVTDGPYLQELENAKSVLRDELENDHLFAHIFEPDAWEGADDYGKPALWRKVNPHIGVTVNESFYQRAWADAQDNAENMIEFKTKLLNVSQSSNVQEWITAAQIQRLQEPLELAALGRPDTMASIDLSIVDDFSAVAYTSYMKQQHKFYCWIDFYIPELTLMNHQNRGLYQSWVDGGWLKVCPGKVISNSMIVDDILTRNRDLRILQIGYDKWKAQEVINALGSAVSAAGGNVNEILRPVPQTYGAFTSPVDTLELAMNREPASIAFSMNPIIPYCFENCFLDEDRLGNKRPIKRTRNAKIDGAIVTLMNFWLFNNYEQTL